MRILLPKANFFLNLNIYLHCSGRLRMEANKVFSVSFMSFIVWFKTTSYLSYTYFFSAAGGSWDRVDIHTLCNTTSSFFFLLLLPLLYMQSFPLSLPSFTLPWNSRFPAPPTTSTSS